ncbi:MAG: methyltransferase domain-containing protein [Thermoplasmata archaeon]|nr:methyltransferase domain-containing protein [Thermoplasmata archaeon]
MRHPGLFMDPTMRSQAAATYNAASDHFDDPALSFWNRFGERTIDRLGLRPGDHVLDVCCGSGASALPAAARVTPTGRVTAVDVSDRLIELCRAKAEGRGLRNVAAQLGDMENLALADESFDAVVCVFGLFFANDMTRTVSKLWKLVRPRGRMAITTWGPRMFEPGSGSFWDAVRAERPELHRAYHPWDRIVEPEALNRVLQDGGVPVPTVVAESGQHALRTPRDWWSIVLGSGFRSTVDQLGPPAAERVRRSNLDWLATHDIHHIEVNVIYATATK